MFPELFFINGLALLTNNTSTTSLYPYIEASIKIEIKFFFILPSFLKIANLDVKVFYPHCLVYLYQLYILIEFLLNLFSQKMTLLI